MKHGATALLAIAATALAGGSACAMSGQGAALDCAVINGEKLPVEAGGSAGICTAISEALQASGGAESVKVRVEVKSSTHLVAHIERGGVQLPAQNLAISDSKLRKSSVERFARAIAQAVVQAG